MPPCPDRFVGVDSMEPAVLQVLAVDEGEADRTVHRQEPGIRGLRDRLKGLVQANRDMAGRLVQGADGPSGHRARRETLESQLAVRQVEGAQLEERLKAALRKRD